MSGKRYLMIINPISGTANKSHVASEARRTLLGVDLEIVYTEYAGHASELAADAVSRGYDAVIAVGGDGTVNEVATALRGSNTVLGIVPMGSGNGLARHLNIPISVSASLAVIAEGETVNCDTCTVNEHPFFCTFGVGFDATVSYEFASRPNSRGLVNYVRSALEQFVKYKGEEYTIRAGEDTLTSRALLIACCNAAQYGNNTFIAPRASITDGQIDVTVLDACTWVGTALSGLQVMTGTLSDNARVHTFRVPSIVIERRSSGPVHLDGEPMEMGNSLTVKCVPGSLWAFSHGEMHVRPIITPVDAAMRNIIQTLSDLFHRH